MVELEVGAGSWFPDVVSHALREVARTGCSVQFTFNGEGYVLNPGDTVQKAWDQFNKYQQKAADKRETLEKLKNLALDLVCRIAEHQESSWRHMGLSDDLAEAVKDIARARKSLT